MGFKLVSVILVFSVCGIGAYIPYRFHFVSGNKTWSEAQTYCREKYTDLATINNMEEMNKLNNTLKNNTAKQAWIGLKRYGTGKWQWSLADQTFHRDGDNYRNWAPQQPDNYMEIEFCVEMYSRQNKGMWNDNRCNKSQSFVCYDEKNTSTNRYILINENKNWYNAQTYCREKHTNLVSVRNQTGNEKIWNVSQPFAKRVWIGLFNNSWNWSDQSNSSFKYWSSNKTSAGLNCTAVSEQHYWTDVNCIEKLPFICHENMLILVKQNLTWKDALIYCRTHHLNLVSVLTEERQHWVKELVQNASTEHVWLGLRQTCILGFWYWVTGKMICYQNWASGKGTGFDDCSNEERTGAVQIGGEKKWISLPQSYKLNFICANYEG